MTTYERAREIVASDLDGSQLRLGQIKVLKKIKLRADVARRLHPEANIELSPYLKALLKLED